MERRRAVVNRSPVVIPGERRTTVTVGTFDGMHRGHHAVLTEIVERARATDRASVLVTFEPHPLTVVAPDQAPRLLTTALERRLLWPLFELDSVVVLRFDDALRRMSPERFVREILVARLRVGELVIGHDHGFGRNRSGDVDTLRRLGETLGFVVDVVGPVGTDAGTAISSTRVRAAVESGEFAIAADFLGRRYAAVGEVVPGAGRGCELGFPTANVRLPRVKCLPPDGVYAVRVELEGGVHAGMANLGGRPTFGDPTPGLEVHLFDWDGRALYGTRPAVEFVERIRDVIAFDNPRDLVTRLEADAREARAALHPFENGPGVAT